MIHKRFSDEVTGFEYDKYYSFNTKKIRKKEKITYSELCRALPMSTLYQKEAFSVSSFSSFQNVLSLTISIFLIAYNEIDISLKVYIHFTILKSLFEL